MKKLAWDKYSAEDMKAVFEFNEGYRQFISTYKTERERAEGFKAMAEANGYDDLYERVKSGRRINTGDKVYAMNRNKGIVLFHIGKNLISEGMRITGAHIDNSRLDLKPYPVYESGGFAYWDTHYYGGMKNYLWQCRALAIHGVVCKTDGSEVRFTIGEKETDPVIGISDLLPHLSQQRKEMKASDVLKGDEMNLCIGSIPVKDEGIKDRVKAAINAYLKENYNLCEEDYTSSEIQVVPAGPARDYGLDSSMVLGYGHDDVVCAYTSFMGMMKAGTCDYTSVCLLVDKEEVGSIGTTGMKSKFFENALAEVLYLAGEYNSDLALRRSLANSCMLSTDVTAAWDPQYPEVMDQQNSAAFGAGFALSKYVGSRGKSGSNDATPQYIARLKGIFDANNVSYQFAEMGKVDQGGGGTIGHILAEYNMDVIDAGVAMHSMHAPMELASKADIYETFRANEVFYKFA